MAQAEVTMERTTCFLRKDQLDALALMAFELTRSSSERITSAALIREAVDLFLAQKANTVHGTR